VVYPAFQSAALVRQRPDLVDQAAPEAVDTVTLVLAGFDDPPASFRVPEGFTESRIDAIQHFVVVEYGRDGAVDLGPADVALGPVDESDLAVLVRNDR
jgi:hypothetical protein